MTHNPQPPPGAPSDAYLAQKVLESLSQEELTDYTVGLMLMMTALKMSMGNAPEGIAVVYYLHDPDAMGAIEKLRDISAKLADEVKTVQNNIRLKN